MPSVLLSSGVKCTTWMALGVISAVARCTFGFPVTHTMYHTVAVWAGFGPEAGSRMIVLAVVADSNYATFAELDVALVLTDESKVCREGFALLKMIMLGQSSSSGFSKG